MLANLFVHGELRYSFILALTRGLGIAISQNVMTNEESQEILDSVFVKELIDESVLQIILVDINNTLKSGPQDVAFNHAKLGFNLARKLKSLLRSEYLCLLVSAATAIGETNTAAKYAQTGIQEMADDISPDQMADLYNVLGRAFIEDRDYYSAAPVFETGASFAHAAGSLGKEWDLLTSVVACHHLLGNFIVALRLINEKTIPLAKALNNPVIMSKSFGDKGNAESALGQLVEAQRDYEEALKLARNANDKEGESNWLGDLGIIYYLQKDLPNAIKYHTEALELSRQMKKPQSEISDLSNLSSVFFEQEKWDDAIQCLHTAIRVAEDNWLTKDARRIRERLCQVYLGLGYYQEAFAINELIQNPVEQSRPFFVIPRTSSASEQSVDSTDREIDRLFTEKMAAHDINGALKFVEDFINNNPNNWKGYFQLGLFHNQVGHYRESILAYQKALRLNPNSPVIYHNLINSWSGIGDLETPRLDIENLVANNPYDTGLRISLGRLYGMLKLHDEAIREVGEAIRLDPTNYQAHLTLCQELYEKGHSLLHNDWGAAWAYFEDCIARFRRVIEMDESRRASSLTMAAEYYLNIAQESFLINPTLTFAMSERELRLWIQAIIYFKRAIYLAPHLRRPRRGYEAALKFLEEHKRLETYAQAGKMFRELGDDELAISFLQKFIDIFGRSEDDQKNAVDNTEIRNMIAEPYYELALLLSNQDADATSRSRIESLYESAVSLNPENPTYVGALRRFRKQSGK